MRASQFREMRRSGRRLERCCWCIRFVFARLLFHCGSWIVFLAAAQVCIAGLFGVVVLGLFVCHLFSEGGGGRICAIDNFVDATLHRIRSCWLISAVPCFCFHRFHFLMSSVARFLALLCRPYGRFIHLDHSWRALSLNLLSKGRLRACCRYVGLQYFRFPTVFHLVFVIAILCWASDSLVIALLVRCSLEAFSMVMVLSFLLSGCICNAAFYWLPLMFVGCPIVFLLNTILSGFVWCYIGGDINLGVRACSFSYLVAIVVFRFRFVLSPALVSALVYDLFLLCSTWLLFFCEPEPSVLHIVCL